MNELINRFIYIEPASQYNEIVSQYIIQETFRTKQHLGQDVDDA